LSGDGLKELASEIHRRWPAVGLAVGVVRHGGVGLFQGLGVADLASGRPITEDTVFRIGSITKTVTAIAVMQLWERGLVDLDAPANGYLRPYKLIPAETGWRPATLRHLLTHTAGIPDVLYLGDLLHPSWGPFDGRPPLYSVEVGEPLPSLAEYYRSGIRLVAEPGSAFAYSNHGFATLGQIVEDVSGEPLDRYFRRHIFQPLGMTTTDLLRSEQVAAHLAKGYVLGRGGAGEVTEREWIGRAGGGVYSSGRDLARYVVALLGGGCNEQGSVLRPSTLATMFEPHYLPHPALPGMGLGFFRHDAGGHRVVGHEGIMPGFNSGILVAPDDGVGVFALTNGSPRAMVWLPTELAGLLRHLLDVPIGDQGGRVPRHAEPLDLVCGRYRLPPVGDLRGRVMMGGGAQVFVRDGQLMLRLLTPVPALWRGHRLLPDHETDPYVFRLDLSELGMPPVRLAFCRDPDSGDIAIHTDLGGQPISLVRDPPASSGRLWIAGALGTAAVVAAGLARRRARRRREAPR
jgi:CubicO group peptidase (beta-lactamase class C family)